MVLNVKDGGLTPDFFEYLENYFHTFLKSLTEADIKKECLLPGAIDSCMKEGKCIVDVLPCNSKWFGVTYQEDRPIVVEKLKALYEEKVYPNLTNDEFYK